MESVKFPEKSKYYVTLEWPLRPKLNIAQLRQHRKLDKFTNWLCL